MFLTRVNFVALTREISAALVKLLYMYFM